jgi:Ca2+-transporting ATPase
MTDKTPISFEELASLAGTAGLPSDRVGALRQQYGANVMTPPVREPLWKQYLEKFDDPIIRILLLAVAISAVVAVVKGSGLLDTIGIIAAVFLSTGIAFFNEYRSSREFDVLNAHRDEMAVRVIRDTHPQHIQAREIVVGDLILLEAGDAVPADAYVTSSDELTVDESAFTGESEPVKHEVRGRVLKGTYVTAGKGQVIASAVGDQAQMGMIAASLGIDHATRTPLEQKLEDLAHVISRFGYAMAALICVSLFIKGVVTGEITGLNLDTANNLLHYFMLAVVIVVAAVPEGLPMSVALSLSLAMRKMTRANCLVRRLIACETIGSATTICTDKTGTLTMNRMTVVESSAGTPAMADDLPAMPVQWISLNAAVNGTAHLDTRDGKVTVIGNSTEGALLRWLAAHGIDYNQVRAGITVEKQHLFDGNRKRMSTVIRLDSRTWLLVKGAPEILAGLCIDTPDLSGVSDLASRAMRTLAFAHREITGDDDAEARLIWDGYVGIRDPLREDIVDAVAACSSAGIRVRMVTGDNPETARAIAHDAGILGTGTVVQGKEFRSLSPEEQVAAARNIDVMARAEPLDKLLLVEALQKSGHVVAVTGDGTNDAPALKHADVGFAMGIAGTEVAREAGDIILLDDSFASITRAVSWGRSLYENIQRFLLFQLTVNFCACLLVFIVPLLGYPEPFTIIQILWINIIMDTLAAFALCSEAPHGALMNRKPIARDAAIITPFMLLSIGVTGTFLVIAGILQMATGFLGGSTPQEISTVFFSAFIVAAVWNGVNCRALDGEMPPFFSGNPLFFVIMGGVVAIQIAIVQFGGAVFETVPLSAFQWAWIILVTASVLVIGFLLRVVFRYYAQRIAKRSA